MKKIVMLAFAITLVLSACGGVKADVADNDPSRATQAIVEKWMAAINAYDTDGLVALYSEETAWMDYGYNDGPYRGTVLAGMVRQWFATRAYKLDFKSYLVTRDGHFSVVQAVYSEKNGLTGNWASTPAVCVLEFKDGKIIKETWYYDTDVFYQ